MADEQAEVTITRTSSDRADDCITVEIATKDRRVRVALTLADFAAAVTGMGGIRGRVMLDRLKRERVNNS